MPDKYQKQKNYRARTIAVVKAVHAALPRMIAAYNALPDDLKRPEDTQLTTDKAVLVSVTLDAVCQVLERMANNTGDHV